eukprot:2401081-Rhodomonas_salina.1
MLGVQTSHASNKAQVNLGSDVAGEVDEMEGIELEAEGYEEGMESGLSAFKVSKFKDRECACSDVKYGYFDPLMIRSIVVCL